MPNLLSIRRFTVSDGVDDTVVTPINSGLKYRWQLEDGTRFYRKRLTTKLLFRGADYTYFRSVYDAGECGSLTLLIEVYCGGVWREEFTGKLVVGQADWHFDRCEVVFDVQPNDVYDCFNRAIKKPLNWLSLSGEVVAETLYGTVETIDCEYSGADFGNPTTEYMFLKDCWSGGSADTTTSTDPDPSTAWRPLSQTQEYDEFGSPVLHIITTWARETVDSVSEPPGEGWINISGTTWVRPISYETANYPFSGFNFYATFADDTISNGRYLSDILDNILPELGCDAVTEVRSDFFGINPPGDAPSNTAYTYADAYFQNCLIFQKSDIVNADAVNDATMLLLTLSDFLTAIRDSLNVYWALEPIGGGDYILRIEHWTYFDAPNGTDLTALDDGIYTKGNNQFKAQIEIPSAEVFDYQESHNDEFMRAKIEYPVACSDGENELDYSLTQMSADVGGLLNNTEAGLIGFVLVCTEPNGSGAYLINNTGSLLNGAMAWGSLHASLWVFGRFSMHGTSTDATITIESTRRFKEQAKISYKYCCEETDFDPAQLLKSGLGWGQIKDAEHDTRTDTITVTLAHE